MMNLKTISFYLSIVFAIAAVLQIINLITVISYLSAIGLISNLFAIVVNGLSAAFFYLFSKQEK